MYIERVKEFCLEYHSKAERRKLHLQVTSMVSQLPATFWTAFEPVGNCNILVLCIN